MTPKQARFIAEYPIDSNATAAAIRSGYSSKTARQMGAENLSKPYISEAIAKAQQRLLDEADMSALEIRCGLAAICRGDIGQFVNSDGSPKSFSQLTPIQTQLVERAEFIVKNAAAGDGHTDNVLKLSLYSRLRALEALAKLTIAPPAAQVTLTVYDYRERRLALDAGRERAAERAAGGEVVSA